MRKLQQLAATLLAADVQGCSSDPENTITLLLVRQGLWLDHSPKLSNMQKTLRACRQLKEALNG